MKNFVQILLVFSLSTVNSNPVQKPGGNKESLPAKGSPGMPMNGRIRMDTIKAKNKDGTPGKPLAGRIRIDTWWLSGRHETLLLVYRRVIAGMSGSDF